MQKHIRYALQCMYIRTDMPNPTFQGFQNKGLILQLNEATLLRSHVFMKRKKKKKREKKKRKKKKDGGQAAHWLLGC